jgi:hypothetical protein
MKDTPETPAHVLDLAVRTEERLHGAIDSFALPGAHLYGVNTSDSILADPMPCLLAQNPDVYTLLAEPGSALARSFSAAALVTTGWAAPLDENGQMSCAPSEHEGRRRVRLTVLVTDAGVASVLRFADDPDEVITDPGSATGSLADAIQRFWFEPPRIDAAV